jgi:hypothetical protein
MTLAGRVPALVSFQITSMRRVGSVANSTVASSVEPSAPSIS